MCSLLTPRYDDAEYANNPKAGQVPKLASGMKAHTALVPGRSVEVALFETRLANGTHDDAPRRFLLRLFDDEAPAAASKPSGVASDLDQIMARMAGVKAASASAQAKPSKTRPPRPGFEAWVELCYVPRVGATVCSECRL